LKILRTIAAARRFRRAAPGPVVLVPTMGALHRGHASLMDRARKLAGPHGTVMVTIFVNPTQFGPREDLSRYPRPFADDRKLASDHGADAIFHPSAAEMYPPDFSTWVDEERVSLPLCGAARPGHFRGVCTVVLKLFQITQPDLAVFGKKDFQQCAVIRRMVRDLDVPIRLVLAETVREPDGLALSSRNMYLTPEERAQAPVIRQAFLAAKKAWRSGETRTTVLRRNVVRQIESAPLARIDYIEFVNARTLEAVKQAGPDTVVAAAVFFGRTRLIDNLWFG
jgi:pantoate--beta-alanine ligase